MSKSIYSTIASEGVGGSCCNVFSSGQAPAARQPVPCHQWPGDRRPSGGDRGTLALEQSTDLREV